MATYLVPVVVAGEEKPQMGKNDVVPWNPIPPAQ